MQDTEADTLKPPVTTGAKEDSNIADLPGLGRLAVENDNITLDMRVADESRPEGGFNVRSISKRQAPILDDKGNVVGKEITTDIRVVDNSGGAPVIYWLRQEKKERPGAADMKVINESTMLPFEVFRSTFDDSSQRIASTYGDLNNYNVVRLTGLEQRKAETSKAADLADGFLRRVTAAMLGDDNFSHEAKAEFSQFQAKAGADLNILKQAPTQGLSSPQR
jgi:hypothetical protein